MTVHVVPERDIHQHVTEGLECSCDPSVEFIDEGTGLPYPGNGPLVVHHCFEMPDQEKVGWSVIED